MRTKKVTIKVIPILIVIAVLAVIGTVAWAWVADSPGEFLKFMRFLSTIGAFFLGAGIAVTGAVALLDWSPKFTIKIPLPNKKSTIPEAKAVKDA